MPGYYLAIDAGTGSGRAVLFDTSGKQVGVGQEEWTHLAEPGVPGSMGFDTEGNWALLCRCIGRALADAEARPEDVRAISTTSMREGIVLYDRDGTALWACANVDGRAKEEVTLLKARDPKIERRFYASSGQTFALGAWPRLEWIRRHRPRIFDRAATVSMINDWICARLCGEVVVEPSNGGTTGLMNPDERVWSEALIAEAGLPRELFPRVANCGEIIGTLTARAGTETGLCAGTPIVAGGGDVQLGTVGLGVVSAGEAAILGGTFWQQVINIPTGRTDKTMRVRVNSHAIAGLNQAECISFFVGLTMRWFRDTFCEPEIEIARGRGIDPYDLLEEMAKTVPPGAHGIIPIFSDAMDFGNWYHAAPSFLNMSIEPGHTTKATLFRALEENAAIVSALNLERVLAFAGVTIDRPIVFAGGASKGVLWAQILADVLGREVQVPVVREATALGCAAAAATGAGDFATLQEAGKSFAATDRIVSPDPGTSSAYREATERWQQAYAAQKRLVEKNVTTPLWRAPGT